MRFIRNKYRDKSQSEQSIDNAELDETIVVDQTDDLLIEFFVKDAKKTIQQLLEITQTKDFSDPDNSQRYIISIHGIKSALANVDEMELSEQAKKLEISARNGDIDTLLYETPDFITNLQQVLEKFIVADTETDQTDDMECLIPLLTRIAELCRDYDRKGVFEMIAQLKVYSPETKKMLDEVKNHALHSDFEEAEQMLMSYIANSE
jgi:HPt (histidine-containing phosphotransfer) domain-containing protein